VTRRRRSPEAFRRLQVDGSARAAILSIYPVYLPACSQIEPSARKRILRDATGSSIYSLGPASRRPSPSGRGGGRPEKTTSARAHFRHRYRLTTAEEEIVQDHLGRVLVEENGGFSLPASSIRVKIWWEKEQQEMVWSKVD